MKKWTGILILSIAILFTFNVSKGCDDMAYTDQELARLIRDGKISAADANKAMNQLNGISTNNTGAIYKTAGTDLINAFNNANPSQSTTIERANKTYDAPNRNVTAPTYENLGVITGTAEAPDPYADAMREYQAEQQRLAEAQRQSRISALGKAKDSALSGLDSEKATIDPYYYDKRNEAASASDVGAMNFAQYMAGRGIKGSAGAMPEMYRNAGLQSQIGRLDTQQAAEHSDIARRRSGVESAYQSDVANANADIDAQTMQNYINQMQTVQAQRIADNAAMGLTSTGEQTLQSRTAQNSDLERQAALIAAANYADIQAKINELAAINPNDPLIPYLQAARQQKIRDQEASQAGAQSEAYDNALAMWKASGIASQGIADILGVPVGAKTADYDISQFNAQTGRINANKQPAAKTEKYSYKSDPVFQSDVTDIVNGKYTLQDVQANAAALQETYGYEGYMELVKLATPKE